jgi:hypothetical protein
MRAGLTGLSMICCPCNKRPDGLKEGQKIADLMDLRKGAPQRAWTLTLQVESFQGGRSVSPTHQARGN